MQQRIWEITITLRNENISAAESEHTNEYINLSWSRETMQWASTGAFFPRYAKLIAFLTDWMRDAEANQK